jgi:phosphoribosyl-ATP pyrophosphohydrolase
MRFRPKIQDIIQEYQMDPVLLIPKNGGLRGIVSRTLGEMGVGYLSYEKVDRDRYKSGNLEVYLYRGEDIPEIIEDLYFGKRIKAIGFTGDDLYDEYRLRNPGTIVQVLETIDWIDEEARFLRPALCLMKRKGDGLKQRKGCKEKWNVAVNRKYEQTSRIAIEEIRWALGYADVRDWPAPPAGLDDLLGFWPEIRAYSGNTETTVAQGINDLCVEVVYTGNSAERNGLEILGKPIRLSDFVLAGVNESSPLIFQREYDTIRDRLANPREGSYTCELAADENKAMKKMGEEFAEFMAELSRCRTEEDKQRVIEEFQDLLFALQLNMAMKDIDFRGITREMYKRFKQ